MTDRLSPEKLGELFEAIEEEPTGKLSELAKIVGLSLVTDYIGVDLSGENLSDDDLRNINLSHANLSEANLSRTNLSDANLSNADLRGANLRAANTNLLNSCYTSEVIRLVFASFICSKVKANWYNLSRADLTDADLTNADLTDAKLYDTKLDPRWRKTKDTTRNLIKKKTMSLIKEETIGAKILVVDDEPNLELLITQIFEQQIENDEFEFVFAHNGQEALDTLIAQSDSFDVVLTDINMPEMDGLTLLERLQESLQEQFRLLKAIVISAYGDMTNIRTAMRNGAFYFITKPFNFDDLELTLDKTLRAVREIREAWKREREIERNLRNFLNALPVGVLVIEPDHKISYVNDEAVKIYGLEQQERQNIIGKIFSKELEKVASHKRCQAGTEDSYPTKNMPILRALQGEENPSVDDLEIRRPDGTVIPLEVSATPIRNEEGKITYA